MSRDQILKRLAVAGLLLALMALTIVPFLIDQPSGSQTADTLRLAYRLRQWAPIARWPALRCWPGCCHQLPVSRSCMMKFWLLMPASRSARVFDRRLDRDTLTLVVDIEASPMRLVDTETGSAGISPASP